MATVKIKFRSSSVLGKEGTLYYQIIHKRVTRQITTDYHIHASEWDEEAADILLPAEVSPERKRQLEALRAFFRKDLSRIVQIIQWLECKNEDYSADHVVDAFARISSSVSFFDFMKEIINRLQLLGKYRTAEAYFSTYKSFYAFREGEDLALDALDADLIDMYEAYLHNQGLIRNSTSFYMRVLRAVYNRAVEKGLTDRRELFRHVYTGIDKTVKRAIPLADIRKIKRLDLSARPKLALARDFFLFSFYTRGMSFIDMAFLKKKNLQHGILTYHRHKTGQRLSIKWEPCMQHIVNRYPSDETDYLLPIIKCVGDKTEEIRQYRTALRLANLRLKKISKLAGLDVKLTMYVSRHSWASAAKSCNVPTAVISEGMGHDSESTTQIYLASLDTSAVDKANKKILGDL